MENSLWLFLGSVLYGLFDNKVGAAEGALAMRRWLVVSGTHDGIDSSGDDGAAFVAEFDQFSADSIAGSGASNRRAGSGTLAGVAGTEGV